MSMSAICLSAEEIERLAAKRLEEAQRMHTGIGKQTALKEVAELKSYAAMKRLVSSPMLQAPR